MEQVKHHGLLGLLNTDVLMSSDNTVKQILPWVQPGCLMMILAKGGSHVTDFGFFGLIFFPCINSLLLFFFFLPLRRGTTLSAMNSLNFLLYAIVS